MITEEKAKSNSIKETNYCYTLACAWEGEEKNSICLERIFVKNGCEEIRLAWWKDGKQMMRPADINSPDWAPLFKKAIAAKVFTAEEKIEMLKALIQ